MADSAGFFVCCGGSADDADPSRCARIETAVFHRFNRGCNRGVLETKKRVVRTIVRTIVRTKTRFWMAGVTPPYSPILTRVDGFCA